MKKHDDNGAAILFRNTSCSICFLLFIQVEDRRIISQCTLGDTNPLQADHMSNNITKAQTAQTNQLVIIGNLQFHFSFQWKSKDEEKSEAKPHGKQQNSHRLSYFS